MSQPGEDLAALLQEHAEQDAAFGETNDSAIIGISELANQLVGVEGDIEKAETLLTLLKERKRNLSEDLLPSAMEEAGMKEFTLSDGSHIKVKPEVYCSIKSDQKENTYEWLDQNGHGSIVKHVIKTEFGRGENETAQALATLLSENGYDFTDGKDVHWQTLRRWAKDELEAGRRPPENLFSLHEANIATVKQPKQ